MQSAGGSQIGARAPSSLDSPLIPRLSPQPCAPPTIRLEHGAFCPRLRECTSTLRSPQVWLTSFAVTDATVRLHKPGLNIPVDTVSDWRWPAIHGGVERVSTGGSG